MKKYKGFTLVELLVVVAIIILFVTISMTAIFSYQKNTVDARIMATMNQIGNVATMIYIDSNNYSSMCSLDHTLTDADNRLKIIKDDVRKFTSQNPRCYATGNVYCVQSTLVSGESFCIDSTGYIGNTLAHCGESSGENIKCSQP